MTDNTKKNALLKLARMKITIGISGKWSDFSTMPLRRDSFVVNMRRSAEWFHNRKIKSLSTPIDRNEIDPQVEIGGAEYDDSNNEVQIGAGTLEAYDDAFEYGSTYLGHEISHAFDSGGRHFDADGNKSDW